MQISIRNIKKPSDITSSSKIRNEEINNSRGELAPKWGVVEKVYSDDNTADVTLRNGLLLRRVTVLSKEWAGKNNNYPFGKQDLPLKGTEVLITFPDNLIEEAVIIGTRFEILGEVGTEQKKEFLKSGQERKTTTINEYGWKTIYDKDTGKFTLTNNNDVNFLIEIDEANTKITITDWSKNKIELLTTGMKLTDKNSNVISMESGKVIINSNVEILQ